MAPRNRFESEYKANFKPYEVTPVLSRHPQPQSQQNIEKDTPPRGLKKKDDLIKPSKTAVKENRALQYKAGLAPKMKTRDRLRYLSEYKKQFDWKKPLDHEAPILSAEKMIYGVHDDLHPVTASKVKMPKKSEYQLQFVEYPIVTTPRERKKELGKDGITEENGGRASHASIEWKEPGVPAGKPSNRPSQTPPPVPKKTMVFQSEYHANFKSPTKYEYVKGAWVGAGQAQPPNLNEISDGETKPTSHAWYQQVIELREKVRVFKARAREGSHFVSLLENLKEHGILQTENVSEEKSDKEPVEKRHEAGQKKGPRSVHTEQGGARDMEEHAEGEKKTRKQAEEADVFKTKTSPTPPPQPTVTTLKPSQTDHVEDPTTRVDKPLANEKNYFKTFKPAGENINPADDKLLWNREIALPGPSLKKTHSISTISHESTVASTPTLESSPEEQRELRPPRREAWPEYRPARGLVIPPYGVSSSSATLIGSDSRSDISLSEIEASGEDEGLSNKPERRPISSATTRLFAGRRQDLMDNKKPDSLEASVEDEGLQNERERRSISSATRRLFTGKRQDLIDTKKPDSFSSDDERSNYSYSSKASDVLSVEAMEKRRVMASETLRRARRRQAQL